MSSSLRRINNLVSHKDKWHSIKKGAIALKEMTKY